MCIADFLLSLLKFFKKQTKQNMQSMSLSLILFSIKAICQSARRLTFHIYVGNFEYVKPVFLPSVSDSLWL